MSQRMDETGVPGAQQVVDLLEVYADIRLAPRGAVLARMRRQVLAEAAARAASQVAHLDNASAGPGRHRSWSALHLPRRIAAIGMAAAMTFATAAAVLAAPPDSPLYDARVTLEQAFLPSRAGDRIAAHERLLAKRLEEADAAADSGNVIALQSALAAYRSEIDSAVADVGDDPDLVVFLDGALGTHATELEKIAAKVPATGAGATQTAVEQALQAGEKAAGKLHGAGRPASPSQADDHGALPTSPDAHNGGGEHPGDRWSSNDNRGGGDQGGDGEVGGDHGAGSDHATDGDHDDR